ncbi:MAG: PspC domain-containing protein [Chitinophagales bacterium]|jgi:phage shock protein PspC (stress-responsive transcriptional regulator)|nr:PspC domain-containing protein [Chitinophagales bacterium]
MSKVRSIFDNTVFGVCAFIGRKLNMPSKNTRLFFVYASFFTFGSPIIIYLIVAFWMKLKSMVNGKRNPVWDL